jgi:hypothetical protein
LTKYLAETGVSRFPLGFARLIRSILPAIAPADLPGQHRLRVLRLSAIRLGPVSAAAV